MRRTGSASTTKRDGLASLGLFLCIHNLWMLQKAGATGAAQVAPVRSALHLRIITGLEMLPLEMRRPALLIIASPHLHRFWITQDLSVFRIQMQFPVNFPRDVGKLQHRNGNVPN
jgi:hypothetical protein